MKNRNSESVWDLITRNVYTIGLSIVVVLFFIFKLFKWFKSKGKSNDEMLEKAINRILTTSTGFTDIRKAELKLIANQVAVNLGTAFEWYHPKMWFEYDEKVFNLLEALNSRKEFDLVSQMYISGYAKGNSLTTDLSKLLDTKYYDQLTYK